MFEIIKGWVVALMGSAAAQYAKLFLAISLVGAVAWLAWDYRGAQAEREKIEAVNAAIGVAVKDVNKQLEEEKKWRNHYQNLAEEKYGKVLEKLSNIKITRTEITNNIRQEVERDPVFYGQPLPDKGYEQWKKARSQLVSPQR